ncbi:MAG: HDOD domain-containing protein [Proteobacteria bacterium]|nr:MAG: HDOD domain-containing protein [Pseudomonadota bacterium]
MGWLQRWLGRSEPDAAHGAEVPPRPARDEAAQDAAPDNAAVPPLAVAVPPGVDAAAVGVLVWEAVLGERGQSVGYRFFLSDAATLKVRGGVRVRRFLDAMLVSQVAAVSPAWRKHRQLFLRLDAETLDPAGLARLGGTGVTLIVHADDTRAPAAEPVSDQLHALRAQGFRLLFEATDDSPWLASLATPADGLAVRVGAEAPERIEQVVAGLRRRYPGLPWCALDVPTQDDLALARKLGCVQVTGAFVSERGAYLGGRFSPDGLRVASLLSKLRQGAEIREMAGVLKQDVALSYRLLRYVNAAAWGLTTPISSIEQAMLMLGRRPLYRWLMLLLLAGAPKAALSEVRGEATLVRARFMELLGQALSVSQRDELFVLGMLSLLDTVLQVPATRVLDTLPMSDTIRAALRDDATDSPYTPYLALARAWDAGDSAAVAAACARLDLTVETARRLHLQAFEWVLENGQ